MINERNEYVNIREILARVTDHPMLKDVTLEHAIRYTAEFIGIVGCPNFYIEKEEDIVIENYKGLLPCGLVAINQARDNKTGLCLRSTTDNFKPREDEHKEPTFKTQGNILFTSFRSGEVTVSYRCIPVDSDGLPLLVNNEPFLKALELYIKRRRFTILYDEGKITVAIMQNAQQDYSLAVAQCEKEFIMPNPSELQSITNMWNTLIPRVHEFSKGFESLGRKEYLK